MQFDRGKLKAVILYICSKCDPSQLGAVKLHKVLYFADMLHYAHMGTAITWATYRKRKLGPTCDQLLPALRDLEREGAIEIRETDYFGFQKKEYLPKRKPEMEGLSRDQLMLIDDVIDFVCFNNTAKTISDYSHTQAWELAEFGGELSYSSALHLFPHQVSPEAMEWGSTQAEEIEAERSKSNAVDYETFAAFRAMRHGAHSLRFCRLQRQIGRSRTPSLSFAKASRGCRLNGRKPLTKTVR